MTRTKVIRGVVCAVVLLLAAGCSSGAREGSAGQLVVVNRPSEATLAVKSAAGFKGSVTISLNVSSEPAQPGSTATITSGNQADVLKAKISHTGKMIVAVTVTGNEAGLVAIGDPVIKPYP